MPISYKVWTDQEDQARNIIDAGQYRCQIAAVTKKRTKSGEFEMLEFSLAFADSTGRQRTVKDWIVLNPDWDWKLRHVARSANLIEKYDNQTLDVPHLVGSHVIIDLGIKDTDKGKMNHIKDYLDSGSKQLKSDTMQSDTPFQPDTDIPF